MGKTILIVDDSVTMRQMVGMTLRKAGFDVIEGATGWLKKPFNPNSLLTVINKVLPS